MSRTSSRSTCGSVCCSSYSSPDVGGVCGSGAPRASRKRLRSRPKVSLSPAWCRTGARSGSNQASGAGRSAPDRKVPVWDSQDLHESDMILAYCSNMRIPSARSMALPTAMDGGAGAASLGNAKPSVFPHGAASTSL